MGCRIMKYISVFFCYKMLLLFLTMVVGTRATCESFTHPHYNTIICVPDCSPGYYYDASDIYSGCLHRCPAGTTGPTHVRKWSQYRHTDDDECIPCPINRISRTAGSISCHECGASYINNYASNDCVLDRWGLRSKNEVELTRCPVSNMRFAYDDINAYDINACGYMWKLKTYGIKLKLLNQNDASLIVTGCGMVEDAWWFNPGDTRSMISLHPGVAEVSSTALCSNTPTCLNTNGLQPNTDTCMCDNTVQCSAGQSCNAGSCSKYNYKPNTAYHYINGVMNVMSASEIKAAYSKYC